MSISEKEDCYKFVRTIESENGLTVSKTKIFKISSEMEMVGLTDIQDKLYRIMSDSCPKLYLQYDYKSMHTIKKRT